MKYKIGDRVKIADEWAKGEWLTITETHIVSHFGTETYMGRPDDWLVKNEDGRKEMCLIPFNDTDVICVEKGE